MADAVIRVEGLGKRYRLGASSPAYRTLRETLVESAGAPLRLGRRMLSRQPLRAERVEFWALRDVGFQVRRGEVLGVVGRNGAGKSTLLKLLSRITEPTEGELRIRGRLAALLEVGTGFHPELTGRENVFLNGAILGMSRRDILRRFDEIVEFAEVEKFIDTQVKHYSSGMYLRLAFSVAAHLEPDILVVDEVLAVGDARFQDKCLGRMRDIHDADRTVVMVSHNMTTILSLCTRCLLIDGGRIVRSGSPSEIADAYLSTASGTLLTGLDRLERRGRGGVRFTHFSAKGADGMPLTELRTGSDCTLAVAYASTGGETLTNCSVSVTVMDAMGQHLFSCTTEQQTRDSLDLPAVGVLHCRIPKLPLSAGHYYIVLFLEVSGEIEDWIIPGIRAAVVDGQYYADARRQYPDAAAGRGVLVPNEWRIEAYDGPPEPTLQLCR